MANPFDYVNAILSSKNYLIVDDASEKEYNPFLTNRALSYHKDAILFAQEMNFYSNLDKKLQFDYLINTIRSTKRRNTKWSKKKEDDNIDAVKEYFGYSYPEAKAALSILSKDQLNEIKTKLEKGG